MAVATKAQPKASMTLPLRSLLLDANNPRFGAVPGRSTEQADILDWIVDKFGVDDVLSSLAVNGYFDAEPMVCWRSKNSDDAVVVEGNRRLAACLILTGDKRAARQPTRTEQYRSIWVNHGKKTVDPVPVIIFDGDARDPRLLSYLGVRHIASAQQWDSYAKAAWVARVVESSGMSVADVALMIGDQHRTVNRLLQGYYFINQLISTGHFRPEDSIRRGRGSVTEYPFSWVYTIRGYSTARNFLGLDEGSKEKQPVPARNLKKAALLTRSMFGNRSKGMSAAITDSREIGDLASALANKEKVALLEQGKTLSEVERLTEQIEDRLARGLLQARQIQSELLAGLAESDISPAVAGPFVEQARQNRRLAAEIEKKLKETAHGTDDDE